MKNPSAFKFPGTDTFLTTVLVSGLGLMFAALSVAQGVQAVFA